MLAEMNTAFQERRPYAAKGAVGIQMNYKTIKRKTRLRTV